jgi:RNA polymerase sigma-70 factor (ECF subfamily)
MDETSFLTDQFEAERPRLRAVAYRMLGSLSDADDAVQEAWLRLSRTDADEIDNLAAWLTTVVARISLNMLRARASHRDEPYEPHIADPVVTEPGGADDPATQALLGDAVELALLLVLDALTPAERLAFVLQRRLRGAVRRDRPDRAALAGGDPPARQPRAAARPRRPGG